MAYTVTISYAGVTQDVDQLVAPVPRIFVPNSSYIDTDVMVNGLDGEFGPSVFATNVDGWGELPMPEPYASTSFPLSSPLAMFKLAVVGENNTVEFEVDTHTLAFMYMQYGYQMADQGFVVEVVAA